MLERDNLRIKSLAKYKTLLAGDINMYMDIENKLVDMAVIKGKAFEDSSMEEYEREIESEIEERGMNIADANYGRRS